MSDPVETRGPEREAAWKAVSANPHLGAVWRGPFFRNGFDAGWLAAMAAADERERSLEGEIVEWEKIAHRLTEALREIAALGNVCAPHRVDDRRAQGIASAALAALPVVAEPDGRTDAD